MDGFVADIGNRRELAGDPTNSPGPPICGRCGSTVVDPVQGKLAALGACGAPGQSLRAVDGVQVWDGEGSLPVPSGKDGSLPDPSVRTAWRDGSGSPCSLAAESIPGGADVAASSDRKLRRVDHQPLCKRQCGDHWLGFGADSAIRQSQSAIEGAYRPRSVF